MGSAAIWSICPESASLSNGVTRLLHSRRSVALGGPWADPASRELWRSTITELKDARLRYIFLIWENILPQSSLPPFGRKERPTVCQTACRQWPHACVCACGFAPAWHQLPGAPPAVI